MPVDRRSGYPRGFADSEGGDRVCALFNKEFSRGLEDHRPSTSNSGITPPMPSPAPMSTMSSVLHSQTVQQFVAKLEKIIYATSCSATDCTENKIERHWKCTTEKHTDTAAATADA